jgi:hypothetical protein
MNTNIWFDLHVGNIRVDDDGRHHYLPEYIYPVQLTTTKDIVNVAEYRDELHRMLDGAIERIEFMQQKKRGKFEKE